MIRRRDERTRVRQQCASRVALLALLSVFDEADRPTVQAHLEPIHVKIADGRVTYDRFALRVDKFTMSYEGQIDLAKGTVDLRTELPLEGLASAFRELRGLGDDFTVPILTRGTFGNLRTELAPEFLERAAEAGFRGVIGDLIKRATGEDDF